MSDDSKRGCIAYPRHITLLVASHYQQQGCGLRGIKLSIAFSWLLTYAVNACGDGCNDRVSIEAHQHARTICFDDACSDLDRIHPSTHRSGWRALILLQSASGERQRDGVTLAYGRYYIPSSRW